MTVVQAPGHRRAWTYTDNLGHNYRVGAKAIYVYARGGITNTGGSPASPTLPTIPKTLRTRAVLMRLAGYRDLWATCYDRTCKAWTTPGTSVPRSVNGTDRNYLTTAIRREEIRPRDQTRQQG